MSEKTPITEHQLTEMFDELLDDSYPWCDVAGMLYAPSRVLKELDPIAYRVSLADYADSLTRDDDTTEIEGY